MKNFIDKSETSIKWWGLEIFCFLIVVSVQSIIFNTTVNDLSTINHERFWEILKEKNLIFLWLFLHGLIFTVSVIEAINCRKAQKSVDELISTIEDERIKAIFLEQRNYLTLTFFKACIKLFLPAFIDLIFRPISLFIKFMFWKNHKKIKFLFDL